MPNNIAMGWEEKQTQAEIDDPSLVNGTVTVAPEGPIKIIKDENGQIQSIIHGDMTRMLNGEMVAIWSEEIIRDTTTGLIQAVKTTRPSGSVVTEQFYRDANGKLTSTKMIFET